MRWIAYIAVGLLVAALFALAPAIAALGNNNNGEFIDPVTGAYTANLYQLYGLFVAIFAIPAIFMVSLIGFLLRRGD